MGRPLRTAPGGEVYHVLNRANGRTPLFHIPRPLAAEKGTGSKWFLTPPPTFSGEDHGGRR